IKNIFFFTWMVLLVNVGLLNAGERKMFIYSPAFSDGSNIPVIYVRPSAGGKNISPPLSWSNLPDGVKSIALSVVDIHPVAKNWVHWLVINIPKDSGGLAEGASCKAMPSGSRELRNSFKDIGYGGPQPPYGTGLHPYIFTVYALDIERLDLSDDITLEVFMKAIRPHVLEQASMTGYFER
uniref:YbhB/YbcL family Raf kinase inhibitor-like protein n=1 Tax=Dissulfurimicrobium sp. TaxID=2022436 RepID=UPI0040498D56